MHMGSSFKRSPFSPSPSPFFKKSHQLQTPTNPKILPVSRKSKGLQRSCLSCSTINTDPKTRTSTVSEKVISLGFEFKSLPEPIDRVKRLLHYATLLLPFDESSRIQENRVLGCTAQVWLEVKMDENGALRFRVDSDSEITKGFCSCLIWVLDGAEADDVLSVKIEDLIEMNVGLPSRGNSRVNTWHNVLISMQGRTRDLVEERGRIENNNQRSSEAFSSFVCCNGSCKETQVRHAFNMEMSIRSQNNEEAAGKHIVEL